MTKLLKAAEKRTGFNFAISEGKHKEVYIAVKMGRKREVFKFPNKKQAREFLKEVGT